MYRGCVAGPEMRCLEGGSPVPRCGVRQTRLFPLLSRLISRQVTVEDDAVVVYVPAATPSGASPYTTSVGTKEPRNNYAS